MTGEKPVGADAWERELDRARVFYDENSHVGPNEWYNSPLNVANCAQRGQVDAALLRLLGKHGVHDVTGARVADFGCGAGGRLQWLADLGADRCRQYGVDLSADRIEMAKSRLPFATFEVGSAHRTTLEDESCDIVTQFCVFSSILDPDLRRAVAEEMDRVLAPGGHVLWQDMRPPGILLRLVYALRRLVWWVLRGRSRKEPLRSPESPYLLLSREVVTSLFPGYAVDGGPAGVSRDVAPVRGRWSAVASAVADLIPALRIYNVFILAKPAGKPSVPGARAGSAHRR